MGIPGAIRGFVMIALGSGQALYFILDFAIKDY
jgi:hypothetical protein